MNEEGKKQIAQILINANNGDKEAQKWVQSMIQRAQQGDTEAQQIVQLMQEVAQEVAQEMQQESLDTRIAKFGAKLNYLRQLKGKCPMGYEMQYYKKGGRVCNTCVKKQAMGDKVVSPKENVIDEFKAKCGKKIKKCAKKCQQGAEFTNFKAECGKKIKKCTKKCQQGAEFTNDNITNFKAKCGKKIKKGAEGMASAKSTCKKCQQGAEFNKCGGKAKKK